MFNKIIYSISDQEIHIWIISLSNQILSHEDLKRILSYSELKKIDDFNIISEGERYLYYRGILRIILSKYINIDPENIIISVNERGKPFIKNSELKFNISHKNDLAVIALGINCEVGVDIEYLRNEIDYYKLIKRFFSREEKEKFNNLRPLNQKELFFRIWTMKEAIVKALGLDNVNFFSEFSIKFSENEILGFEFQEEYLKKNWWFQNRILLNEYVCSVVTTNVKKKIKYFNL
ncbi:MAG: 4'-phosphopantetheinyl transferase psf-1 [Candidatus Heimdallarchaeota archaeon LC_3]|nr:MAG: 4'-phosphopantetheinyl transferase psf-1 [Candidatus Heimdallarchaeota archaeon LC_3]